jgi:protein phosphatase
MDTWIWIAISVGFAVALVAWPRKAPDVSPAARAEPPSKMREPAKSSPNPLPQIEYEEDADLDPTKVGAKKNDPEAAQPLTTTLVYDEDARTDEPTKATALILVSATAQTDKGLRRKQNEDSLLVREDESLFVVADGMGGYSGGQIASALAVDTIAKAFASRSFRGKAPEGLPRQAAELAQAIQMANVAILEHAKADKKLTGMGTTICAARFSPNKQRLYIGHVGDSRVYRMRGGTLTQMTADHTMKEHGVTGAEAAHLSRAVGVWPIVPIDVVLAKPLPEDTYLLCSDGLTKMVAKDAIAEVLKSEASPAQAVEKLIEAANERGGLDNITVILVRVRAPSS